jgi:hypothetical protein
MPQQGDYIFLSGLQEPVRRSGLDLFLTVVSFGGRFFRGFARRERGKDSPCRCDGRSSYGVYRRASIACSNSAAVVTVACHGKTFSSSTRCVSSSRSEQQSPTTSSL